MALLTDIQVEDLKLFSKSIRELYGIDEFIADREERTRLLREVLNGNYMQHWGTCYRSLRGYSNTKPEDCNCGAHALLAEISQAIGAQP